jgi:hypothetical protein
LPSLQQQVHQILPLLWREQVQGLEAAMMNGLSSCVMLGQGVISRPASCFAAPGNGMSRAMANTARINFFIPVHLLSILK